MYQAAPSSPVTKQTIHMIGIWLLRKRFLIGRALAWSLFPLSLQAHPWSPGGRLRCFTRCCCAPVVSLSLLFPFLFPLFAVWRVSRSRCVAPLLPRHSFLLEIPYTVLYSYDAPAVFALSSAEAHSFVFVCTAPSFFPFSFRAGLPFLSTV